MALVWRVIFDSWVSSPRYALLVIVALAVWQFGAPMVIFLAGLKQIPRELYDASSVDGAGWWRTIRSVTLPMLSPVVFFNLVLETIHAFQAFHRRLRGQQRPGRARRRHPVLHAVPLPEGLHRRAMTIRRAVWHAVCVALLAVLLYPVAWLVTASFKPAGEIVSSLRLLPEKVVLGNYADVFHGVAGISVWRFLANSLLVSGGAVVGNVVSCSLAAYAFAWLRFRLRRPLFAQYTIFQRLHMVDTFWPLILPRVLGTDAFFVFLIVQFMRGLPTDLGDAARIDGCRSGCACSSTRRARPRTGR